MFDPPVPGSFVFDPQVQRDFGNKTAEPGRIVQHLHRDVLRPVDLSRLQRHAEDDYTWDNVTIHWDSQYFEHVADLGGGPTIPDYFYHGISASPMTSTRWASSYTSRDQVGVSNTLFDKDPPLPRRHRPDVAGKRTRWAG